MSKAQATPTTRSSHQLRDFVRLSDGRIGLIVLNDQHGGIFRSHALVWFGAMRDGLPDTEHVCLVGAEPCEFHWLQATSEASDA